MNKKIAVAAVAAGLTVSVAGGGAAIASSQSDDGDATVSGAGAGADKATAAALKATDGGTANSVERDSENGATWEVEVTRKDGSTVDVRLDEHYDLVVIEGDSAG